MRLLVVEAEGAIGIINGSFDGGLDGWQTEGEVVHSDHFSVLRDRGGAVTSIFQTVELGDGPIALEVTVFRGGMSMDVDIGEFPDVVFATLYLGSSSFGDSVATPIADEAIGLFDLDSDGFHNSASGALFTETPGRPGWVTFGLEIPTSGAPFATLAFEIVDGNAISEDSTLGVDDVDIFVIPEPRAGLLVLTSLGWLLIFGRLRSQRGGGL